MSASSDEPILRVEGLRKNFGARAVCDGISFDLWPGEVLAVVGESGAGKTSLLKCLSGQTPIDEGHAYYRNAKGREIDIQKMWDLPPATFSGGEQQRVNLARGFAVEYPLMLLDEPTGGLDVSVQARLLDLLRVLVRDLGLAAVLVTHDLAVARLLGDRLLVMKDGKAVELGLVDQVLDDPQTPYAQLLVSSVLQI